LGFIAKLEQSFFERDTLTIARELLGLYLVREFPGARLVCRITETEAYVGRIDKACHAYGYRRTARTETLFAPAGTVYIYLIYGMYHCLNFVTEAAGEPAAVLIRAGSPILGEGAMSMARFGKAPEDCSAYQRKNFLNGPGKLCKALSLTRTENNSSLTGDALWVSDDARDFGLTQATPLQKPQRIHTGARIGIDYAEEAMHFPWRFWIDP